MIKLRVYKKELYFVDLVRNKFSGSYVLMKINEPEFYQLILVFNRGKRIREESYFGVIRHG